LRNVNPLPDRLPDLVPLELDLLEQLRKKLANGGVAFPHFLVVVVIRGTGDGINGLDRSLHRGLLDLQVRTQLLIRAFLFKELFDLLRQT
jgi:hypothetical protein